MQYEEFDLDMVIRRMQDAVDVVLSSEHDTSKVAACLFDPAGNLADNPTSNPASNPKSSPASIISRTNHRPEALKARFEWTDRIGKSSQFIHAETACLLEYGRSAEGHSICVTDPFCPNCAKTLAESGVKRIFIDHKGMDKDFVQRRAGAFNVISLEIAQKAGIDVYILYRKDRRVEPLRLALSPDVPTPAGVVMEAVLDVGVAQRARDDIATALTDFATESRINALPHSAVCCFAASQDGRVHRVMVHESLPPGLSPQDVASLKPDDTDKYRFTVDALNKLYFAVRRHELKIIGGAVYCNRVPSSRAFVNMLLTDIRKVMIAGRVPDHDVTGEDAARLYADMGLIEVDWL